MLGDRLKKALAIKGITQAELADKCDMTEVSISRYISNARMPKADVLVKMADALGVTTDYLLGHDTEKDRNEVDGFLHLSLACLKCFADKYPEYHKEIADAMNTVLRLNMLVR